MNHLQADSIRKSYGDKLILSDIFLSCNQGETVGLIGRNGSGKSTLLKIIFGIENAENKYVKVNKKMIRNLGDSRNLINYLPQNNFLPTELKVLTIIKLFLQSQRREFLLNNEHVKPLLDRKFQNLSGGEKRILEILLLIYSEAKFILLDEPFEGVSPLVRDYILKIVNEEKSNKGFIITDHDYENVLKISDKILFLSNGNLKEIRNEKDLQEYGYLTSSTYTN
ncbi:ATP-binding cassette domain-containing protein [Christiangramia sp. SM2212]|uniref:ATP-binding cassette domain-containing protein n=1 Tax=Christiangramia sediminicola TaxID=3073267 RepID=A0ABU1EPG5_9FLAO|nr:ATP-binding cassette domain-containing protein [Christiangramia sp. SM2212]MDR5589922.1 ATP-binding cassette domain-containing protein [Christiangramia sp. SM2212]